MTAKNFMQCLVVALVVAGVNAAACRKTEQTPAAQPAAAAPAAPGAGTAVEATAWYRCPMEECHYAQQGPGKCPQCGMDLVPAPAGWVPPAAAGGASSCTGNACGCGTAPAAPAPAAPALEIKTAGELAPERIGQTEGCPVGGDSFTVTAETPAVAVGSTVHLFGCLDCAKAFAADPSHASASACPHHAAH